MIKISINYSLVLAITITPITNKIIARAAPKIKVCKGSNPPLRTEPKIKLPNDNLPKSIKIVPMVFLT